MRKLKKYEQFLFESKLNESQINEGYKEVLLSLGLLAGVFTGDVSAQTAKQKIKNSAEEIENILTNKSKIQSIVNDLEEYGMNDAAKTIEDNAEELLVTLDNFKSKDIKSKKKGLSTYTTKDINEVVEKLRSGWAISEITLDTVKQTIESNPTLQNEEIEVDSLELNFEPNQLFEVGSFELTEQFINDFTDSINTINQIGGTVLKIKIESSTDKQRVSDELSNTLEDLGFSGDNKGLSSARNNAVKDVVKNLFEENGEVPLIEQDIKFEQGKGEIGAVTPQDPQARYVKVIVYFTQFEDLEDVPVVDEQPDLETLVVIKTITLKKPYEKKDSQKKVKFKKGKQRRVKGRGTDCPLF